MPGPSPRGGRQESPLDPGEMPGHGPIWLLAMETQTQTIQTIPSKPKWKERTWRIMFTVQCGEGGGASYSEGRRQASSADWTQAIGDLVFNFSMGFNFSHLSWQDLNPELISRLRLWIFETESMHQFVLKGLKKFNNSSKTPCTHQCWPKFYPLCFPVHIFPSICFYVQFNL